MIYQAMIHIVVAAWPLTFAIFGLACFLDCPASPLLPLMIFMAGIFGSATVVLRLIKCMWQHLLVTDVDHIFQISILGLDLTFLMLFIIYNYFLFNLEPSYDSHSENYCNYSFYNFNYKCNFASIAFLVLYAFWKMISIMKPWFSSRRS
ncbi:uncharacterized protein TNCT_484461 [Trichonephila clavata]|uniref:Uncharacterized protein n=1 Tax=Trichonephila clavata TaxID=2740835 RepID=A0A8X6KNK5_TRICU|nr:uncharacterized protein TNCT_484461 [Trichonephila clavata]